MKIGIDSIFSLFILSFFTAESYKHCTGVLSTINFYPCFCNQKQGIYRLSVKFKYEKISIL